MAQQDLRELEARLARFQQSHVPSSKEFTQASVRKMIARLREELVVYECGEVARATRGHPLETTYSLSYSPPAREPSPQLKWTLRLVIVAMIAAGCLLVYVCLVVGTFWYFSRKYMVPDQHW